MGGCFDEQGKLRILDRVNSLQTIAGGRVICPSKLEDLFENLDGVQQIFVHGSPQHSHTVALIVPAHASGCAISGSIDADLIRDPGMISKMLAELTATAQARGIPAEEIPRAVALLNTPWSPQ